MPACGVAHLHKRCKDKQTTQAITDAMELIGLPGKEVKVHSGKGKAITKADLPALSGPEVKKMLEELTGVVFELDRVAMWVTQSM
eukprot:jgi/Tetstr1/457026/TSEL_043690.t1